MPPGHRPRNAPPGHNSEEGDTLGQALREALARRADRAAASWVRELPEAVALWARWLDELEAADRAAAARMRAAGERRGP
jgi:hypothetical protein